MENSIGEAIENEIDSRLSHIRTERDLLRREVSEVLRQKDELEADLRLVVAQLERERIHRDHQESYLETYCNEDYAASVELQKTREKLYDTQRLLALARKDSVNAWTENAALQLELDNLTIMLKQQRESLSPEKIELIIHERVSKATADFSEKLAQAHQLIERAVSYTHLTLPTKRIV